jgi:hypothetical protein
MNHSAHAAAPVRRSIWLAMLLSAMALVAALVATPLGWLFTVAA